MIYNEDLDKSFDTKEELIKALVENKRIITAKKKNAIKTKRCSVMVSSDSEQAKSHAGMGVGSTIYPVINTTNWLDSHDDCHSKTIWNKSAKEQTGKTFFLTDHNMSFDNVISYPQDVEIMLREVTWKELGQDIDGVTNALIFKTELKEYANKSYLSALKAGLPIEHSIRMRYIDLELCVNDKQYEDEYKAWQAYISEVANSEKAYDMGYFYYIKEAAIAGEGSAVLRGSNSVTPTLTDVKQENIEPPSGTQLNKEEGAKSVPVWFNC